MIVRGSEEATLLVHMIEKDTSSQCSCGNCKGTIHNSQDTKAA